MRSFKAKVLSACAWAVPVLSTVIPQALPAPHAHHVRREGRFLELDARDTYAQATFSVPCAGCLGPDHASPDDEYIILSLKAHTHSEPCGASNITLNGLYLPQEWQGDIASGTGSYTGVPDVDAKDWLLQHDLDLEWENVCLHGEGQPSDAAQILTVNIKAIDGKAIRTSSGFTVSFKQQQSPPELLRLEAVPNRSASDKQNSHLWLAPPADLRLTLPPKNNEPSGSPNTPSLEDEIRELKVLQAEVKKLQLVIEQKKVFIASQIDQESQNVSGRLRECDSFKCVVKTIAKEAHGAWKTFYVHLSSKDPHNVPLMGASNDADPQSFMEGKNAEPSAEGNARMSSGGFKPFTKSDSNDNDTWPRMPSPNSPFVMAIEVVLGILCCGCLVTVLRHRCCSLRRRTERAAAREERNNARAYRRAARKHAWRNWWRGNWRDRRRIEDYEEKRHLIQDQENVLEDAMQEEIRQLRAAHGIVNELIGAEEGRFSSTSRPARHRPQPIDCNFPHHSTTPEAPYSPLSVTSTYPPTSIPELPSRPLSRTDSLPGYASSSPPAYEEDEDVSGSVPNGFRNYAPSTASSASSSASSRWTPESSVVDVSPRPSADTLRYAETVYEDITETSVEDKE